MSVFRLTDVSNTDRESKQYWDERVVRDWEQPMHGLFGVYPDDRIVRMDRRNLQLLSHLFESVPYRSLDVLECACGYGRYAPEIASWYRSYVGIDFAEKNIGEARARYPLSNVSFRIADMATFETEQKFDLIFMVAAWSSIEQRSAEVLAHLKTLLKPNGKIAVLEEHLFMVIDR